MPPKGAAVPLSIILERPAWQFNSRCYQKNLDPELFHPPQKGRGDNKASRDLYAKAREHCNQCHTREECLQFALDESIWQGMYGGYTPKERRRILNGLPPKEEKQPIEGRDSNGKFAKGNRQQGWDTRKANGSRVNQYQ